MFNYKLDYSREAKGVIFVKMCPIVAVVSSSFIPARVINYNAPSL